MSAIEVVVLMQYQTFFLRFRYSGSICISHSWSTLDARTRRTGIESFAAGWRFSDREKKQNVEDGDEGPASYSEIQFATEKVIDRMSEIKLGDDINKLVIEAFEALVRQDESEKSTLMLISKFKEEHASISLSFCEKHNDLRTPFIEFWEDFQLDMATRTYQRHLEDSNETRRALARICTKLTKRLSHRKEETEINPFKRLFTRTKPEEKTSRANAFITMGTDFVCENKPIHAILSFYAAAEFYKKSTNGDEAIRGIDTCSYKICLILEELAKEEDLRTLIVDHMIPVMRKLSDYIPSIPNSTHSVMVEYEAWCLFRIGRGYYICKEYHQFARENETAIKILETEFKERANKYIIFAYCLNNAGAAYERMGIVTKATEFYSKALEVMTNAEDYESEDKRSKDIEFTKKNLTKLWNK